MKGLAAHHYCRLHSGLFSVLLVSLGPAISRAQHIRVETLPALPEAVSNNAVAALADDSGLKLFSFQGLSAGRTITDIHNRVRVLKVGERYWQSLRDVPGRHGRLAGGAATAGDAAWLFGGYTVASDGAELSTAEVWRLDLEHERLVHATDMPVPVDDMVAFSYHDRFIYLVSGWHDLGNVNLVQVLDTQTLSWAQATPYPGAAVFGHSGGMFNNQMLVCDGVRIEYPKDGSARQFLMSDECWLGTVDERNYRRIQWQPIPAHPGAARYRMASAADGRGRIVFSGGSDNPYNYNGIGYNGTPSEPLADVFSFDLESMSWRSGWVWPEGGSMDHRGLLHHDGWFYLIGGMLSGQKVSDRVIRFRLDEPVNQ